jgi:hypothetical protein
MKRSILVAFSFIAGAGACDRAGDPVPVVLDA